ncbi:hypothetical protein DFH09DRAFT_1092013 [Mycena vulgaris]|nr:hypothetical protein DFH09DRAFT_1092013 [Mycena vulgaris]
MWDVAKEWWKSNNETTYPTWGRGMREVRKPKYIHLCRDIRADDAPNNLIKYSGRSRRYSHGWRIGVGSLKNARMYWDFGNDWMNGFKWGTLQEDYDLNRTWRKVEHVIRDLCHHGHAMVSKFESISMNRRQIQILLVYLAEITTHESSPRKWRLIWYNSRSPVPLESRKIRDLWRKNSPAGLKGRRDMRCNCWTESAAAAVAKDGHCCHLRKSSLRQRSGARRNPGYRRGTLSPFDPKNRFSPAQQR